MGRLVELPGVGAEVEQQLGKLIGELEHVYHRQLLAVFLYGSAARGDFIPGRSDLNLLIVLQSGRLDNLEGAARLFHRWRKLRIAPLLLTAGEIGLAGHVFPLELSEIKESGRLLYGSNPLDALQIGPEDLRAQCRREVYGGIIRLRQEYIDLGDRRHALGEILAGAMTPLLPVFRALLRLEGSAVPPTDAAVVEVVAARHHLDRDLFSRLLDHKHGSIRLALADMQHLFERLILEWERVIALVHAA